MNATTTTYHHHAAQLAQLIERGESINGHATLDYGPFEDIVGEIIRCAERGSMDAAGKLVERLYQQHPDIYVLVRQDAAVSNLNHKTSWTAAELLAAEFPEPEWLIPGILPEGLTILAGRPKLGKSWLALQWAGAIGAGGLAFGERVEQRSVLYLALEDSPRRLKNRMTKQLWTDGANYNVQFETTWLDLAAGGVANLQQTIHAHRHKLIIIDTLSRAAQFRQKETEDTNNVLSPLQRLAVEEGISILVVDHHRKMGGVDDVIESVSGSTAKTATADCIIGLYRGRGETTATFKMTGRDVNERELALTFDKETCLWQCLGAAADVARTAGQQDLLDAIDLLGDEATTTGIAEYLDKVKPNVSRDLYKLLDEDKVIKPVKRGQPWARSNNDNDNNDNNDNHDNNDNNDNSRTEQLSLPEEP